MSVRLFLDGSRVHDIPSFYDEVNRVFMADEAWSLGPSLDALDDMLYGSYGALAGEAPATVVWTEADASRAALGIETTRAYLQAKLDAPAGFNVDHLQRQRAALDAGTGATYFEIVLSIFAAHPNLTLVLR